MKTPKSQIILVSTLLVCVLIVRLVMSLRRSYEVHKHSEEYALKNKISGYLNNVLRPNIARLCEYAGREHALVGNAIASGMPIFSEAKNEIKHYRSIVEESLGHVLFLKNLPFTSSRMKQAIETFDEEFLQSFQLLREDVFLSSERQENEVSTASMQIVKREESLHSLIKRADDKLYQAKVGGWNKVCTDKELRP